MRPPRLAHCPRCDDTVETLRPARVWKPALRAWYVLMLGLAVAFPIMASDFCVMLPTMMALILAGSPLHRLARERPSCLRCSYEFDDGFGSGTGVRIRPIGAPRRPREPGPSGL